MSFGKVSFAPHFAGACVATALVLWAGIQAFLRNMQTAAVPPRRLVADFAYVFAIAAGHGRIHESAGGGTLEWLTVAHAVMGAVTFGASVTLAALVYRRIRPEDAELAHGGVVIA